MLTFLFPIVTALIVISSLDYFSDNDVFSVSAIRSFEQDYQSPSMSDIALVTFDRQFSHETSFPETRRDILELAEVLVEHGAKLVVLDYLFDYSGESFPISETLKNKIVVGSQVVYRGNRAIELAPPPNLFPGEILMHNWGKLSLFDTEDRYGAVNSLVYYQTVKNERIPSLSLAVFHRSHNAGNNTALRKSAVGIPENLISNGRYWLVIPNNLSELDNRTYSAWDVAFKLENNFIDVEGKTVFVATTWDVNQDHFYIGSQSTDSFFNRVLIWSGLSKQAGHDGKLPGVYAHISAYLNLVDGHYYLHPGSDVADSHSMKMAYTLYTLICIVLLAVYWGTISSTLRESQYRQLSVFACALAAVGILIILSYLYAAIVFSEYQLSLSLTLPLLVAIFIVLLITAKVLDRDKKNDHADRLKGLSHYAVSVPVISYAGWQHQGNKSVSCRSQRGGNGTFTQSNDTDTDQEEYHDL
ncbi:CHASE2 domain-containing protein [Vibrio vulnificus]|uniref:CHASE2 domain-containing protein n=1 Tax=Vibrio vulnificus TaxID=672 RepID=UPI003D9C8A40